jgi:hypothetical protein
MSKSKQIKLDRLAAVYADLQASVNPMLDIWLSEHNIWQGADITMAAG